ncbi:hypothetical protein BKA67DRAFT_653160 [Truncatella angustata]|uniref:C2H2-type domain-containing protein n=1 Tax=Truncatella angustata TaxID=152316 RepID=A0A9P8UXF9_9PEZI|nr:uncharacterized protein BKA67DRAFT_653160 [Truncatella angustata]KAH6659955.1 hypothetical protein BKA67DRAFT_653160 [Truncatella angustata]
MSSNPRRTPVSRSGSNANNGLSLKTSNLTLRKGATFHSPSSPSSSSSTFKVPSLPRRSQTSLDDVIDASRRRAALTIGNVDSILTGSKSHNSSQQAFRDEGMPVPRRFLDHIVGSEEPSAMDVDSERRVLRPRPRRSSRHHESDSGLGTSVASTGRAGKEAAISSGTAAAITRSVSAIKTEESLSPLSSRAINRIHEHTLRPLLAKKSLKEFQSIILDCPRRIQENQIVCLRDLEKTLIFMAPVSQLLKDTGVWGNTYRALCLKERAKSAELYRDFCMTSIRCIQATVDYLSDHEQTRPNDRPYSSGYFIDLVEQIRLHAEQLQTTQERQAAGEELDEMAAHPTDEVKLMGGLATTGRPAELVRIRKDGKAISIATGQPVEELDEDANGPIRFKRSMSEQLADDEEIMRSMARRKKNATPEELAPKKCKEPGCNKEFKRPCDLTKHEKTHSRPWKCPVPTCKYHEYGWPTEKEMDRHVNDKHTNTPMMYECHYKPCPYKSKRESNCKQHMEKAHGWTYVRTKTNGKGTKAGSSAPTPVIAGMPTPDSDHSHSIMTPPDQGFSILDTYDMFPAYPTNEEFDAGHVLDDIPFDGTDIQLDFSPIDNATPSTDGQFSTFSEMSPNIDDQFSDIYHARLPTPTYSVYDKSVPELLASIPQDLFPSHAPVHTTQIAPHISPAGHGNTMLFTPASMIDEGFDEFGCNDQFGSNDFGGNDFLLFPNKSNEYDGSLLMNTMPSAAAGFSQPSSQDFNMDFNPVMDWTSTDFSGYTH